MAVIIVDGREVQIGDDEKLNCIQAADRAGVTIPFYCWHPGLSVVASCRMCLVETGQKNKETGKIEMVPKLVPGCQTPVKDGTVIVTNSPKVKANQQFVQEGLLLDHPVDCPICDQAGECWLQDYYFNYGHKERQADVKPFTSDRRELGEHVTLFADRCVMCSRCVRFTREVSGGAELQVINRGSHAEIDIFPGFPIDNNLSGNVNDLCPVGALCSSDFLYQQRVWFMEPHDSVCVKCSSGCSVQLHENHDQLYRIQPRFNPNANEWWMCDKGRFENQYINAPERIGGVKRRGRDQFENCDWPTAITEIQRSLQDLISHHGGKTVAAVISPFLTVEEAYLLCKYIKGLSKEATLVLGKIPTGDKDEVFAKGFTIRAEKCPNRRGVEEVLKHFQADFMTWDQFLAQADAKRWRAAYITGLYPETWNDEADAARIDGISLKIVQDFLPSAIARKATYVLPGVTFAEKGGCYVNHAGLIQSTDWGLRPFEAAHIDGQIFSDLAGRRGLYQPTAILSELAAEIPFFARAATGVPDGGLNLVTGTEKSPLTSQLGTVTHPIPTFRTVASEMLEIEL
ncbi:MAG: molybdopterin-dependent oxidoreductase [Planctomycetota bacterium]